MDKQKSTAADRFLPSSLGVEMLVKDAMTTGVITAAKYDNVMRVADILMEQNISGMPVVDKANRVIGIITQADILSVLGVGRENMIRDLLRSLLGEPIPERKRGDVVGDVMTSRTFTINPGATIAEAVGIMDDRKIRRLLVVDDQKNLMGIITRADILKAVIKRLK